MLAIIAALALGYIPAALQITHRRASYGLALAGQGAIFPNRELHGARGDLLHRGEHVAAGRNHARDLVGLALRAVRRLGGLADVASVLRAGARGASSSTASTSC